MTKANQKPNTSKSQPYERLTFTIDKDTMAALDEVTESLDKEAKIGGYHPPGMSSAIRKSIQHMHTHLRDAQAK